VCFYNRCHGNAVKGFWVSLDNTHNVCVVTTVSMVMLLRDFVSYGIIFMTVFTTLDFPVILDGQFTSLCYNGAAMSLYKFSFLSFPILGGPAA
jgi:hypothetical protein